MDSLLPDATELQKQKLVSQAQELANQENEHTLILRLPLVWTHTNNSRGASVGPLSPSSAKPNRKPRRPSPAEDEKQASPQSQNAEPIRNASCTLCAGSRSVLQRPRSVRLSPARRSRNMQPFAAIASDSTSKFPRLPILRSVAPSKSAKTSRRPTTSPRPATASLSRASSSLATKAPIRSSINSVSRPSTTDSRLRNCGSNGALSPAPTNALLTVPLRRTLRRAMQLEPTGTRL